MIVSNAQIEVDVRDIEAGEDVVSALSLDQLQLIAGGECVVNSI